MISNASSLLSPRQPTLNTHREPMGLQPSKHQDWAKMGIVGFHTAPMLRLTAHAREGPDPKRKHLHVDEGSSLSWAGSVPAIPTPPSTHRWIALFGLRRSALGLAVVGSADGPLKRKTDF